MSEKESIKNSFKKNTLLHRLHTYIENIYTVISYVLKGIDK